MGSLLRIGVAAGTSASDFSSIFKRETVCVVCGPGLLVCPTCDLEHVCQITAPTNCGECAQAYCVPNASSTVSQPAASTGPNTGVIVGGVVGGLAAIAIITYLVWRFCIKNKRGEYEEEEWQRDSSQAKEGTVAADFESRRSQRQSMHSVHSLASTVLTRASNIIQIAYIPGVTNRATPNSPTVLVPPVPPIPLALSDAGSPSPYEDQHFFVPGALRDSTYSGISNYSDRTSYARTSYAPRSSVASTIYGKNAVVGPVQKGTLLKPSLVSVKSKAASTNSGASTPPVPAVDYDKYEQPPPSPAFSIGATFFKKASASTATSVRPQVVRVGSGPKMVDVKSTSPSLSITEELEDPNDEPLIQLRESRTVRDSNAVTIIDDTPTVDQGPFSDPPARSSARQSSSSLGAVIEEATRRAAETHKQDPSSLSRARSPFGDEHAVRD